MWPHRFHLTRLPGPLYIYSLSMSWSIQPKLCEETPPRKLKEYKICTRWIHHALLRKFELTLEEYRVNETKSKVACLFIQLQQLFRPLPHWQRQRTWKRKGNGIVWAEPGPRYLAFNRKWSGGAISSVSLLPPSFHWAVTHSRPQQ
jgi:hypothetical protein